MPVPLDNVDYTRQEAAAPGDDEVDRMMASLRRDLPWQLPWHDPDWVKRLRDEMAGALSGQDTTANEDARLKQGREEGMHQLPGEKPIPAAEHSAARGDRRGMRYMNPDHDFLNDPEKWNRTRKL